MGVNVAVGIFSVSRERPPLSIAELIKLCLLLLQVAVFIVVSIADYSTYFLEMWATRSDLWKFMFWVGVVVVAIALGCLWKWWRANKCRS
jgi:formate-dependent nitrite reductase membrane component NrfD